MRVLAIDTSGVLASVALLRDGEVEDARVWRSHSNHTTRLVPELQRTLADAGYTPADVGAVGVAIGPGAFSGLRVGVTTAKLLCWSLDIPLLAVGSLHARAELYQLNGEIVSATDAGRGEWYWARYRRDDRGVIELSPPTVGSPSVILAACDATAAIVGENLRLPEGFAGKHVLLDSSPQAGYVAAIGVARLAWRRWKNGEWDIPALQQALYVRRSAAEERKRPS
ncbi:MAG: tRNA (adenosine(37)-N6)-threonylcarbamoyltransferase complex dimerization subunit type 1 TsaB [Chloroflexi bacterium]|nr:tRNA (adenosine(37)-N6)-threonylcarbamoyltransferase complex dimerization subunit type 1 TsaB [Chloroflexota bacterium]